MLQRDDLQRIRRGLELGFSQRQVAVYAGVSRSTVAVYQRSFRDGSLDKVIALRGLGCAGKEGNPGKIERCSECGGLVLMPCLACSLRKSA